MSSKHARFAPSMLMIALAARSVFAATEGPAPTLNVGDKAPPFTGRMIKGEPLTKWEPGKLYVIECWATWCGPCKASIPHVNALYNKYKDQGLIVIGQDVWETEPDGVEPFVKSMGDKMSYNIALDAGGEEGRKGTMAMSWLAAAGKKGIPATFIVDGHGTLVWTGHPTDLTDDLIEKGLAGKLDAAASNAMTADAEKNKAVIRDIAKQLNAAMAAKDFAKSESLISDLTAALPDDQKYMAMGYQVDLLLAKGQPTDAATLAEAASHKTTTNVMFLHTLASKLAMDESPRPVLTTALEIASRTNDMLGGKDATSMLTIARIQMRLGDQAGAIATQTKVVEVSKPAARPRMQGFLDDYKAGRMPSFTRALPAPATRPNAAMEKSPSKAQDSEDITPVTAADNTAVATPAAAPPAAATPSAARPRPATQPVKPTLTVGDPAPAFVGTFIQGEPVTKFEPGKAYLVEFWATWCGPCKKAIPHVNALHKKYKDKGLVVIGQDVWEKDDALPKPFVEKMGDGMSYRIAVDDKSKIERGVMSETWMTASGQHGIPCSYLIGKDGKIAWIGMPFSLTDAMIDQLLDGTFDVPASAAAFNKRMGVEAAEKSVIAQIQAILYDFNSQLASKDFAAAKISLDKMLALKSGLSARDQHRIDFQQLRLTAAQGDTDASIGTAKMLLAAAPTDDVNKQNVCRMLLVDPPLGSAAIKLVEDQLNSMTEPSATTFSMKARVQFIRGDAKAAAALEEQAVAIAPASMKSRYEAMLKTYQTAPLSAPQAAPQASPAEAK